MNRTVAIGCLALLAACGSTPKEQEADEIRTTFEDWIDANVRGDVEASFTGMSAGMVSHWLWRLFEVEDSTIMKARADLKGTLRTDLDLWLGYHQKHRKGNRAERLPRSVLQSTWLRELYTAVFKSQQKIVKSRFSRLRILDVYVDASGATVSAKVGEGPTELFAMAIEGDRWKIDGHRSSLRRARQ